MHPAVPVRSPNADFDSPLLVWLRYARLLNNPVNNPQLLRYFEEQYVAIVVLDSFLTIGVLAERKNICNVNTITKEHSFCLPYILAPLACLWMMAITTHSQICATSTVRSI